MPKYWCIKPVLDLMKLNAFCQQISIDTETVEFEKPITTLATSEDIQ